jgi:hypothetical protein
MKKKTIILSLLFLLVVSILGSKSYIDSKVRTDIYDNTKKYNELLIKAVNNFKENGNKDIDLFNNAYDFLDKYKPIKTTKEEDKIIHLLSDEILHYSRIIYAKKSDDPLLIKSLSRFENTSIELTNYFKK